MIFRYERSFSPPRSSNSSGYGTGSSNKSFSGNDKNNINNVNNNGAASTSKSTNCNALTNGEVNGGVKYRDHFMKKPPSVVLYAEFWDFFILCIVLIVLMKDGDVKKIR